VTLDIDTALSWRGKTVVDRDGEKIGKLRDVYLDRDTDMPAYAGVATGLFGSKETYVRLDDAQPDGDDIRIPFDKAHVLDAPSVDPGVALTAHEELLLDEHYAGGPSPRSSSDDHAEMVRSEEELHLHTRPKERRERVRLKKVTVTDEVERTVPVRREEVRLEEDPPPEGRVVDVEEDPPA
jgi:sporulation protein YlmC with PRC-barrel domain